MGLSEPIMKFVNESEYWLHETKKSALLRFVAVLTIIILYFIIVIAEYGLEQGVMVTLLTWAFFIFCTPIADAGFLLDFPIRMFTGIKMIYSEMIAWFIALTVTLDAYFLNPEIFQANALLRLFHHIISEPFPYWLIVLLCAIGTFMSVYFGDELFEVAEHHERERHLTHKTKHKLVIMAFIMGLVLVLYDFLLQETGGRIAQYVGGWLPF